MDEIQGNLERKRERRLEWKQEMTVEKRKLSTETLDSSASVEIIDNRTFSKRCFAFFLQLILSIIVLCALSGALVWSFVRGEAGVYVEGTVTHHNPENFTVFITQFSEEGRMLETIRGPDGGTTTTEQTKSHSWWIQNDTSQVLIHRYSAHLTVYAMRTCTLLATTSADGKTVNSCSLDKSTNYTTYIERSGLTKLIRPHGESVRIKRGKNVLLYQGEPAKVQLPGENAEAFLVFAYADADTGVLLGYDTYFTNKGDRNLFKREYWYGEMVAAEPKDDEVSKIPEKCAILLAGNIGMDSRV